MLPDYVTFEEFDILHVLCSMVIMRKTRRATAPVTARITTPGHEGEVKILVSRVEVSDTIGGNLWNFRAKILDQEYSWSGKGAVNPHDDTGHLTRIPGQ